MQEPPQFPCHAAKRAQQAPAELPKLIKMHRQCLSRPQAGYKRDGNGKRAARMLPLALLSIVMTRVCQAMTLRRLPS